MRYTLFILLAMLVIPAAANAETDEHGRHKAMMPFWSESWVEDWQLHDHYTYRVELKIWSGDELVGEPELGLVQGTSGMTQIGSGAGRYIGGDFESGLRVKMLARVTAAGQPFPRYQPRELNDAQQQLLAVANEVTYGDLTLRIYAPGADRYEARLYRTLQYGGKLEDFAKAFPNSPPLADVPPAYIDGGKAAEEYLTSLTGALDTPELDVLVPVDAARGGTILLPGEAPGTFQRAE